MKINEKQIMQLINLLLESVPRLYNHNYNDLACSLQILLGSIIEQQSEELKVIE